MARYNAMAVQVLVALARELRADQLDMDIEEYLAARQLGCTHAENAFAVLAKTLHVTSYFAKRRIGINHVTAMKLGISHS